MNKERILSLASTIGVILTGLISAISLLQMFTSVTIIEILENQKLSGIVFILFVILFGYKYFELKSQSKGELPNIKLGHWYVDERIVTIPAKEYPEYTSQTGSSNRQQIVKVLGSEKTEKYYFAHVVFINQPPAGNAMGCIPEIEFYNEHMNRIAIYGFYGRFGQERNQPTKREFVQTPKSQLRVDILANGDKYELDIAMKHKEESFCFAFNDDSYSAIEFRRIDYKLPGNKIFACVHLRGQLLELPPFWFEITNGGKGGSMKINKIPAPKIKYDTERHM